MNEETLKNALEADIEKVKKITLLGDRVIILLDVALEDTTTESGIIIPQTEIQETDGGKLKTRPSAKRHLYQGTILNMSSGAIEKFKEMGPTPFTGDKVYVAPQALNSSFYFYPDRTKLVQVFDGFIIVPHNLIEAKL